MVMERLQILVSADTRGAQRELEQVGEKAQKELGKAETAAERTSKKLQAIGTTGLIGSAAILGGLGLLAKASDDAEIQVTKLENSIKGSNQTFKNNGQELVDLAESIQQVTAADADAIIGAQSLAVQFGLTEDQVKILTPLIVDLSRKLGIDLESATKLVNKGIDGNAGAFRRVGIDIDEAALKADGFGTVVSTLQQQVGGFARAEGETFSGQLERIKNNLGDIGESVGAGAADVLGSFVGAAADGAKALNDINPGILNAVGGIGATAGVVGATVSALTLAAGAASNFRQQIRSGDTALTRLGDNGQVQATKIGKAIGGIAIVGSIVGIAETVASVSNSINDIDSRTQLAFDNLRGNLDGTAADAATAFSRIVELEDESAEFAGIWQGLGDEVQLGGIAADVEEFQQAFSQVLETVGPEASQKIIDGLRQQNAALDQNSEQYKINAREIDKLQRATDLRREALVKATTAERDQKRATEEAVEEYDRATGTIEGLNNVLEDTRDFLKLAKVDFDANAAAARAFGESIEQSTFADDQISAAISFNDALTKGVAAAGALPGELDAATIAIEGVGAAADDTGEKAIEGFLKIGDSASKLLQTFIAAGDEEGARNLAATLRQQIIDALTAQGITDPQRVDELLGLVGLQDVQIEAALRVANVEEELLRVQTTLQLFEDQIATAPPEVLLKVQDQLLANDLVGAQTTLQNWVTATSEDPATSQVGINALVTQFPELKPILDEAQKEADDNPVDITATISFSQATKLGISALEASLGIDIPFLAKGGPLNAGQLAVVGEKGPELFLPKTAGTVIPNDVAFGPARATQSSTLNLTQNIVSADPIQTAAEVVRRQRDAEFLAGV